MEFFGDKAQKFVWSIAIEIDDLLILRLNICSFTEENRCKNWNILLKIAINHRKNREISSA